MRRGRIKPSKGQSAVGMAVGILFVIFGLSNINVFGFFGVIWTFGAVAITIMHGYNVFSDKGISTYELDIETTESNGSDFESRIRQLTSLKEDGLITDDEFESKRKSILNEKW